MDGLALLCTLHADGPATLKRLRSAGFPDLAALVERPVTELAAVLDVAPAVARRLLREARLLAERVGPELDAEDSPVAGATPVEAAMITSRAAQPPSVRSQAVSTPPPLAHAGLDGTDRALLERIVRAGRAPAPTEEPSALERIGVDLGVEGGSLHTEPDGVANAAPTERRVASAPEAPNAFAAAVAAPVVAETPPSAPRPAPPRHELTRLEGVDDEFASELVRAGCPSLNALAEADTLALRRELRITFAQAKRLCFLARRLCSADALLLRVTPPSAAAAELPDPSATAASEASVTRMPLAASRPAEPGTRWRIVPQSEPLATPPEVAASVETSERRHIGEVRGDARDSVDVRRADPVAPASAPEVACDVWTAPSAPLGDESVRPRFWEPRSHLSGSLSAPEAAVQGVAVDPAEVQRPRRFWEARQSAAQVARDTGEPSAPSVATRTGDAQEVRAGAISTPLDDARRSQGGTTLGWNFEIPRPLVGSDVETSGATQRETPARHVEAGAAEGAEEAALETGGRARSWRPLAAELDDSSAGPFA